MRKFLVCACLLAAACAPAEETPATDAATAPAAASSAPVDTAAPEVAPSATAPPDVPAASPTGADDTAVATPHALLRGRVSYPSEELPAMRVCALATEDVGLGYCAETAVNAPHYELRVPPGTWILLAWPQDTGTEGAPGLLSMASECLATSGLNCDDHDFFELTVDAGETREGLDINDWYYPPEAPPLPMEPRGETLP
jgi:hypothetical protein